jgi:hypothetical protein
MNREYLCYRDNAIKGSAYPLAVAKSEIVLSTASGVCTNSMSTSIGAFFVTSITALRALKVPVIAALAVLKMRLPPQTDFEMQNRQH